MLKYALIYLILSAPPDPLGSMFDRAERNPSDPTIRFQLAEKLRMRRRSEEAIVQYEALLKLQPNHKRAPKILGRLYTEIGDCEKAIPLWTDLSLRRASDPESKMGLGFCAYRAKEYESALGFFRQAEGFSPRDGVIQKSLGLTLLRGGKFEEAQPHLEKAMADDPDDPSLRLAMILLALHHDRPNDAQPQLERYAWLSRNDRKGKANADLLEGVMEALRGRLPEATEKLAAFHNRHPDQSDDTLYLLGRIEYDRLDNDAAKRWLAQLIQSQPSLADPYFFLSAIEARESNVDSSIKWLDMAIQRGFNRWGDFDDPAFDRIRLNEAFVKRIPEITQEEMDRLVEEIPGSWVGDWIREWALRKLP